MPGRVKPGSTTGLRRTIFSVTSANIGLTCPLLLFLGWADVRKTAGVSVVFILVNSLSGLMGHLASVKNVPHEIVWWAPAALVGGFIGSELGSRRLAPMTMRRLLAVVLVVAGVKMLLT